MPEDLIRTLQQCVGTANGGRQVGQWWRGQHGEVGHGQKRGERGERREEREKVRWFYCLWF